jgi:hypothetical protein
MEWITKKQKHSQPIKEKRDVQISDLSRLGSMPLSCFYFCCLHRRAENTTPELGASPYVFLIMYFNNQNLNLQIG